MIAELMLNKNNTKRRKNQVFPVKVFRNFPKIPESNLIFIYLHIYLERTMRGTERQRKS